MQVFFLKAMYRGGEVEVDNEELVEHMWVTKEELRDYVSPDYFTALAPILLEWMKNNMVPLYTHYTRVMQMIEGVRFRSQIANIIVRTKPWLQDEVPWVTFVCCTLPTRPYSQLSILHAEKQVEKIGLKSPTCTWPWLLKCCWSLPMSLWYPCLYKSKTYNICIPVQILKSDTEFF